MTDKKECFVICPIGSEESDTRENSDKFIEHIVEEAVDEFGYETIRADKITNSGSITSQVIQRVVDSDLVIADLSEHNANVFYELAVRHATGKPYIQLIKSSQSIPFDLADFRTIKYGFDVDEAKRASREIQDYIRNIDDGKSKSDNPISRSAQLQSLTTSDDPIQQNIADIMYGLNELNKKVDDLSESSIRNEMSEQINVELAREFNRKLDSVMTHEFEALSTEEKRRAMALLRKQISDDEN
ncbi:hypothetical protein [Salinigranum halophilum]|uniref:hypothetical protein n=1 Tax=Salinigranum halophilum TaxID=2565931 RepID=UPI00115E2C61|nr:hypothetical protein [Salinigranum halophilum]